MFFRESRKSRFNWGYSVAPLKFLGILAKRRWSGLAPLETDFLASSRKLDCSRWLLSSLISLNSSIVTQQESSCSLSNRMPTTASWKVMAEEAPDAYKDVSEVVDVTHGAGISIKVAKLLPLGVVKG